MEPPDVAELSGQEPGVAAEGIAEHLAAVSGSYQPVQHAELPAFLPAPQPPQVTEFQILIFLRNLKDTLNLSCRPTTYVTKRSGYFSSSAHQKYFQLMFSSRNIGIFLFKEF